jgi:hypothetical protein
VVDKRKKDLNWQVADEQGQLLNITGGSAHLAVMMDIRDELQRLNRLLHCQSFINIPSRLQAIEKAIKSKRPRPRICSKCHGRLGRGLQHHNCKKPDMYI